MSLVTELPTAPSKDTGRWDELKLVQDTYMRTWQIYISWFTWFANINILALGWVLISVQARPELTRPFVWCMWFFIFGGVIATASTIIYSASSRALCRKLAGDRVDTVSGILPSNVTLLAGVTIFLCLVVLAALWGYVAYPTAGIWQLIAGIFT